MRQREERFRSFVETAAEWIWEIDRRGRITYSNAAVESILGFRPDEIVGADSLQLVHPDEQEDAAQRLAQMVAAKRDWKGWVLRWRRKDGTYAYLESNGTAVFDAAGEVTHFRRWARDISERKRVEEALQFTQFIMDHAVEPILWTEPAGRIFYVNDAVTHHLGYTREQLLTMHVWDIDPDYPRHSWRAHWEELKVKGSLTFETRHRRQDGAVVPVEVRLKYLQHGNWEHGCAFARDITERKQAEAALRQSEQRFRAIFDSVNDAIFVHDLATGAILDVNRRMCEMYGYTREEAIGLTVGALSSGDVPYTQQDALALIQKAAAGEPQLFEWQAQDKAGRLFWVEVNLRRATIGGEERMLVTVRDITERRRLQSELHQRNQQLAEEIRRKDEFLAVLGHELRNPLAPIRNAVYRIRHLRRVEPAVEHARTTIERQVTHMARLVDDLLDVSRITWGKILLRKELLDLSELLSGVAEDYRPLLEAGVLSFDVRLPSRQLWVSADPARISQIVGNLLQNAGKFTNAGGDVILELTADRGTQTAVISVRDTGLGIAPELLMRIFNPFSQMEQTIERSRGGLGLGLALVKGLVDLHGGSVRGTSAGPGCGSEFRVCLPLEEAPVVTVTARDPSVECRPRSILIIDDSADTASTLRLLLEDVGHRVEEAHSARDGLEKAREFLPDAILCDIGLPGDMDGYDFARVLRQDPTLKETYLIAMTGYGTAEDRRCARNAGFDVHLTKPADLEVLEQLLACIGTSPADASAHPGPIASR